MEKNWERRDDNIDWVFTFLRDTQQLKLETFYIENSRVVHMPDRLLNYRGPYMAQWKDKNIHLPLYNLFYGDDVWDVMPIFNECVKIDLNLSDDDFYQYMQITGGVADALFIKQKFLESAKARGKVSRFVYNQYSKRI